MTDKEKQLLFKTILFVIVLVNLTLFYGLFSHFVLRNPVEEINLLLGGFGAEVVGCTVVAWRKLINTPHTEPCGTLVIEKPPLPKDESDAFATLMEKGHGCLVEARDCKHDLKTREQFARRAAEIFALIPKEHPAYHDALYNSGTAY